MEYKKQPNFKVGDLVGRRSIKSRIGIVRFAGPEPFWEDEFLSDVIAYYGGLPLSAATEGFPHQIYWLDIGVTRTVTAHTYEDIYKLESPDDSEV